VEVAVEQVQRELQQEELAALAQFFSTGKG
jgi:hypothetical protein